MFSFTTTFTTFTTFNQKTNDMNTINKYLTPKELIVIAEEQNLDSSIVLSKKLKPLSKKERLKYLEDLIMLFRVNDEQDEMIKAMTPMPLTDYIIMLRDFEEKHNRKPNQREKNQMHDELKDKKLHSDEYYRLRTKAEKWLSNLQDDFITVENKTGSIIDVAISGLQHKQDARSYLKLYAIEKERNQDLLISEYIKNIGEYRFSDVTYRGWIEKYDKAEKML